MKKLFIVLMVVLVTGCASELHRKEVRTGDTSDIKTADLIKTTKNELLVIQFTITNKGSTAPVNYRIRWLDSRGMIWAQGSWKPVLVIKGRSDILQEVAPSPEVRDFRVEFTNFGE